MSNGSPPSGRRGGRATMTDVAALAGVSIATVSRVLNGTKRVGEPTASLVREAARRLEFHPSRSAQLLARRRTRVIGLVISDLLNETLLAWTRAAASRAEELGYQIVLCDGRTSPSVEARQLEQLLAARVDAICLVGPVSVPPDLLAAITHAGVVLTPRFMHEGDASLEIRARAERPAIHAAVDALAAGGCRWIVTCATPLDAFAERVFDGRRREVAARAGHHGIRVDPARDHVAADGPALRRLLRRRRQPGALVALNHDLPGAVVAAVLACGRTIPDDVAIVAFGDSRGARNWLPRTSVITRDMEREAQRHVDALVAHLAAGGDAAGPPQEMEEATFVARDTTPRPRPAAAGGARARRR